MRNNIYKYLLVAAAVTFAGAFTSCDEKAVDDLQGIYQAPTDLTITSASVVDKVKDGNLRTFTVQFNSNEGVTLNMVLVSNQYYLTSTSYTKAGATAKNGNYLSTSSINGGAVVDGSLALTQNGDDYTISNSVLFTADGKAYRMKGNVTLPFEVDDPTPINVLKSATDNGNGTVTVVLSTGGYTESLDMTTYQMVYTGEGNDFQIIFNCPDGKLHEGTYAPGTGYVAGYTFMNNAYEVWGVPAFEDYAGSLWYTIAGGAKTPTLVTKGDIVVKKNGPLYTILIDQGKGGIYAQFQGAIGDLDPDGDSGAIVQMTNCVGVSNYAALGWIGLIDLQFANGSVTSSYDEATYTTTYYGSGEFLQIEVYSEQGVGTLERGTYEIADDSSFGPMKFKVGAVGMYGDGGTYSKTITDGALGEANFITSGTLTIEGEGDDTKITLKTDDTTYMFSGNIGI